MPKIIELLNLQYNNAALTLLSLPLSLPFPIHDGAMISLKNNDTNPPV